MTYGELFKDFLQNTNINNDDTVIYDYRPCDEMYGVPSIPNAIVIWLKDGTKIIYIGK